MKHDRKHKPAAGDLSQQSSRRNQKRDCRREEAERIRRAFSTEIEQARPDKGRDYFFLPLGDMRDRMFLEGMVHSPFVPELEPLASVVNRVNMKVLKNGRQLAIRLSLKCERSGRGKEIELSAPRFPEAKQAVLQWLGDKSDGPECGKNAQVKGRLLEKVSEATSLNGIRNLFYNAGAIIAIVLVVIEDGIVVKSYSDDESEEKPEVA